MAKESDLRYRSRVTDRKWTPDAVRRRIQATKLAQRLQKHAFGLVEMSVTQIRAAEILLRKAVPDLSASTVTSHVHHHASELSDAELESIVIRSRERVAAAQGGETDAPGVHRVYDA